MHLEKLRACLAGAVLVIGLGAGAASAQTDEECYAMADTVCGGEEQVACMSRPAMMEKMPPACQGTMQTMIEMAREATAEQDAGTGQDSGSASVDGALTGKSYGGVLRSGPGQEFGRVASLREGAPLDIIEETDVWFNDYRWFRVSTPAGTGYHWGGIICVNADAQVAGIFDRCS